MSTGETKQGRRSTGAVLLIGIGWIALSSCATINRTLVTGMLDSCQKDAECDTGCADATRAAGNIRPGDSTYCDVLEIYSAEAVVRGKDPSSASDPRGFGTLRAHERWTAYLCNEGITRACAARDGLRSLLAKAEARYASDKDEKVAVTAKLAEAQQLVASLPRGTQVNGFQEHLQASKDAFGRNDFDTAQQEADGAIQAVNAVIAAQQKAADELAQKQAKMQAETASIEAAATACTPTGTCKAKCDGGDGPSCVAWGNRLWQGSRDVRPKLPEARAAMSRACDAGIQTGCETIPQIDVDIRAVAAKVDELWGSVQAVGDDIATELGKRDLARSLEPQMPPAHQMQTERAIQRMMAHQQAVISEQYCPARKAFLAQLGVAEFAKRVAAHCKNDPPVGSGQGGEDVPLTSQCQAAYATACP